MAERPNPEAIYLKAWDIYQARIAGMGEARWRVLMLAVAGASGLASYGFVNRLSQLYIVAIGLCVICAYLEYLYLRIQHSYIHKTREVEHALRDIVLEAPEPFIPKSVVDTDPRFDEMPRLRDHFRFRRAAFWIPYVLMITALVLAFACKFIAPVAAKDSPCCCVKDARAAVADSSP